MEKVYTLKKLEKEYVKIKSVVSGDTKFVATAMFYLCNNIADSKERFYWLISFLKENGLIIGEREGNGFKELTLSELHDRYNI